jgi:aspartate racemase
MKTVGVLGGASPQATMDFEVRFHREAQRRIPQRFNMGYPPLVVAYVRRPPMVVDENVRPILPMTADPAWVEAARWLGTSADFLVITSNVPHLFLAELEAASGRKVLSMIDRVLDEVRRRGWRRAGVMGFGDPRVYTAPLGELGIACETLPPELRGRLDRGIAAVMECAERDEDRRTAAEAVAALRERDVEGTILGCTEIPLLLGAEERAADLIHPLQLLAEAAVEAAIEGPG